MKLKNMKLKKPILTKFSRDKRSGFLLIELVVALAIFALFMSAILHLQSHILVSQKQILKQLEKHDALTRAREKSGGAKHA